jgi:hypothetical protein
LLPRTAFTSWLAISSQLNSRAQIFKHQINQPLKCRHYLLLCSVGISASASQSRMGVWAYSAPEADFTVVVFFNDNQLRKSKSEIVLCS